MDKASYRAADGKLLAPIPGSEKYRITPDNARDMLKKRQESYRRAALKRIVGEVNSIDPTVSTAADAFGVVAARQVQLMMDAEKPDINGLEKLYKLMTGIIAQESQRAHEPPGAPGAGGGVVSASVDTLLELVNQIEQHKLAAVDAARATDAGETIQAGDVISIRNE